MKADQDVYIAVRAEVITQNRSKQGEFCNPPLPAKLSDLASIEPNPGAHVCDSPSQPRHLANPRRGFDGASSRALFATSILISDHGCKSFLCFSCKARRWGEVILRK